jgi:hypothetical protein
MKRRSFFTSLAALTAFPKLLTEDKPLPQPEPESLTYQCIVTSTMIGGFVNFDKSEAVKKSKRWAPKKKA